MATINVKVRDNKGTRNARRLRAEGLIPCNVYGHGQANESVAMDEHDVLSLVKHGERLLELNINGQMENVLVKEVQYDSMGDEILHLDLARVNLDERVEVTVPIMLRGTPAGAAEGGVLQQIISAVTIECLVTAIPDEIRQSVAEMKLGDHLTAGQLTLPQGAALKGNPEAIIATVSLIIEAEEAPAAVEGPAEPEVLTAKKEEEGEAAEGEKKE